MCENNPRHDLRYKLQLVDPSLLSLNVPKLQSNKKRSRLSGSLPTVYSRCGLLRKDHILSLRMRQRQLADNFYDDLCVTKLTKRIISARGDHWSNKLGVNVLTAISGSLASPSFVGSRPCKRIQDLHESL